MRKQLFNLLFFLNQYSDISGRIYKEKRFKKIKDCKFFSGIMILSIVNCFSVCVLINRYYAY
jgi:hypothetical protein